MEFMSTDESSAGGELLARFLNFLPAQAGCTEGSWPSEDEAAVSEAAVPEEAVFAAVVAAARLGFPGQESHPKGQEGIRERLAEVQSWWMLLLVFIV